MFSLSRVFLASSILVSGILAAPTSNSNLATTCGFFALIGSGFNNAVNFTLTAFPPADILATSTGAPLVIGALGSGDPVLFAAPSGVSPTIFNLTDGTLFVTDHEADISFTAGLLTNGSDASFIPVLGAPTSIPQFCAVADTDPEAGTPFPTLAVNGTTNNFSFCNATGGSASTQLVVFKAVPGNSAYTFSTCTPVNVLLTGPAF